MESKSWDVEAAADPPGPAPAEAERGGQRELRLDAVAGSHMGAVDDMRAANQQLRAAVASNRVIGAALGMVMERLHLDREAALAHLIKLSQNSNTRLAAVAEQILAASEQDSARRIASSSE
ncbi:ANTAR domain-containing protein [Friedmanniella luteola]|uniref:ANTAR domain-containing protein n=1 Tax=Friedmanniella luteola TaxID=546871 RepID=UPI000B805C1B|nr:ANTAR domain-containing protein [Friedmanniella luteola]